MLIHLNKSKLFTEDPAIRFAKSYSLEEDTWKELWKRYKLMDYSVSDLCEYMKIKTGQEIIDMSMRRWLMRAEIYLRAKPFIEKGATTVTTEFFGHLKRM